MSASERLLYLYLFLFVHLLAIEETTAVECKKINDCECTKSNGNVMSLKPIDGTSGPKFPDIDGTKQGQASRTFTLSWNPCTKFTDDSCKDVLICQKDGKATIPVAEEASTFEEETDGSITLTYNEVVFQGYTRTGIIKLICDKDQYPGKLDPFVQVEATGGSMGQYKSTFHSQCVCDEGCSGGSAGGLSTGSILLIVFFVLLLVYLIAGLLYQRYRKGVESLPEMIPNYSFWADFPFLIKDGCVFTFQGIAACCKRCCMKLNSDSYASI